MQDCGVLSCQLSDEERRRAIRAYYASVSYIDRLIGKVIDALRSTRFGQDTVIVFTSDHGDMLGHHGMWYKKSFYDQAARIPLLIAAPGIAPQRVGELVSLVDLLPTFMGIAASGEWSGPVERLEGTDLLKIIGSLPAEPTRPVYAEYLAESISAPVFMIRRKNWKFICSPQDPSLLYDLDADPGEFDNLAAKPEYRDVVDSFEEEARSKWDVDALTERVLLSQKRRRLVTDAMRRGEPMNWDHGERALDETPWYRGGGRYNDWALTHLAVDGSIAQPGPMPAKSDR